MALFRCSAGGGGGSNWTEIEAVSQVPNAATFTIGHSLTIGKTYHIFMTNGGTSAAYAKTNAEITVSSGASSLTLIDTVTGNATSSAYAVILHYSFTATSQTVIFSKSAAARQSGYVLIEE